MRNPFKALAALFQKKSSNPGKSSQSEKPLPTPPPQAESAPPLPIARYTVPDIRRLTREQLFDMARAHWPGMPPQMAIPNGMLPTDMALVRNPESLSDAVTATFSQEASTNWSPITSATPPSGYYYWNNLFLLAQNDLNWAQAAGVGRWMRVNLPHAQGILVNFLTALTGKTPERRVVPIDQDDASAASRAERAQKVLDRWIRERKWDARYVQACNRQLEDGEAFVRWVDKLQDFRFIEPEWVWTPTDTAFDDRYNYLYGIQVPVDDYETPVRYWWRTNYLPGTPTLSDNPAQVMGPQSSCPASEVVHFVGPRRRSNTKRDVPFLWYAREELLRLELFLRMLAQSGINIASISLIFKWPINSNMNQIAKGLGYQSAQGVMYEPEPGGASIIHTQGDTTVETPIAQMDYADILEVVAALVRQVASMCGISVQMVDQALTAKYSNEEIAERNAIACMEAYSEWLSGLDEECLNIVLRRLVPDSEGLEVRVTPVPLNTPSQEEWIATLKMLVEIGCLSRQTAYELAGIGPHEWEQERERMEEESEQESEAEDQDTDDATDPGEGDEPAKAAPKPKRKPSQKNKQSKPS